MKCLEQLIGERLEKALADLRENPEFTALLQMQVMKLDTLINSIGDERTKKEVIAYSEQKNAINHIQLQAVYKAGAQDAITLLKTLGVI